MSFSSPLASPIRWALLTPEVVTELGINVTKGAFPSNDMPHPKREFKKSPMIDKPLEFEVDGFWYGGFSNKIAQHLGKIHTTEGDISKEVSVTNDGDGAVLMIPGGAITLSCHRRFMLNYRGPIDRKPPSSLIYICPVNLELTKATRVCSPELTLDQYVQALLAAMAARVPPNTLIQVLRPAVPSDISGQGVRVDEDKVFGLFVRTALKVPSGPWAKRFEQHPIGIMAYEELLDFNELPVVNGFLHQVAMMTPGRVRTKASVTSTTSYRSQ